MDKTAFIRKVAVYEMGYVGNHGTIRTSNI